MDAPLLDLGKLSNYRFQVINQLVPNTSAAGTYGNNSQLDRAFNRIVGVGYFETNDGGIPGNYSVGIKTDRQVWIDPINIFAWMANENVPVMCKYYSVNIPYGAGDTLYPLINTNAVLTDDLTGQLVLILVKDNIEQPRM